VTCRDVGLSCDHEVRAGSARAACNQFWLHAWAKHRHVLSELPVERRARIADLVRLLVKARVDRAPLPVDPGRAVVRDH
jgi:hypothetical protein